MIKQGASIRIMLVDDDVFMLKLLGRQLTAIGFAEFDAYDSGAKALTALEDSSCGVDLILLDLNMPEMDGLEFLRHLVDRAYAGSIVLISGEDDRLLQSASALVRAHRIGLLGFLHKPATKGMLLALLQKWLPSSNDERRLERASYDADAVRAAIDNNELLNYYQPVVNGSDGRVVGVETLVRWRHPVDGIVYPDRFIDVAEAHGLIDALTRVVMRDALAQLRSWRDAGLGLQVAINISMENLATIAFADFCVAKAALAGVQSSDVTFEVTESRLMTDLRKPLEILTRLRVNRFRLSIDDFGTGHSSLKQLHDFPFDELKIDRGFVHSAWQDQTAHAIFDASFRLARQLHMKVVAEGVEDRADWDFVRRAGCDLVQGYFIARPMPGSDIPAWIAHWESGLGGLLTGPP